MPLTLSPFFPGCIKVSPRCTVEFYNELFHGTISAHAYKIQGLLILMSVQKCNVDVMSDAELRIMPMPPNNKLKYDQVTFHPDWLFTHATTVTRS